MNVGATVLANDSAAVLPFGRLVNDHEYVIGSLSASEEPLPSSFTKAPTIAFWLDPALATGAVFVVVIVTVDGVLLENLFLVMSCATYAPGRSATNVGLAIIVLDRTAVLLRGLLISDH